MLQGEQNWPVLWTKKKVFTSLDLEIKQRTICDVDGGENGTGKSSLISLLTGFKGRNLFAFFS